MPFFKYLKGSRRNLIETLSQNLSGKTEKNTNNLHKESRYLAKIRTHHLPNKCQERNRYVDPLAPDLSSGFRIKAYMAADELWVI
jgi:hypothetical protein